MYNKRLDGLLDKNNFNYSDKNNNNTNNSIDNPLCRMWGERGESVQHIVSECEKLAQKEYKRRHDKVANNVHWDLCKRF